MIKKLIVMGLTLATLTSCKPKVVEYASMDEYPVRTDELLEMNY